MRNLHFIVTLVAISLVAGLNVLFNYQIAGVTDSLTSGDRAGFIVQIWQLLAILCLMLVAEFVRQVCNQRFLNRIGYKIQATLVNRFLQGPSLLKQSEVAARVSAIHNDSEMVKELYYDTLFSLYQGVVSFLFACLALFGLDSQVSIAILLLTLVPIGLPYLFQNSRQRVQETISQEKAAYQILLNDLLSGLVIIKNADRSQYFSDKTNDQYKRIYQLEDRKAFLSALLNVLSGLFFYLLTVLILCLGGQRILAGQMTVGALVAIYSISLELTMPISLIASSIADMASVRNLREQLLKQEPALPFSQKNKHPFTSLQVRNLSFSIEGTPLFSELSLNFEPGKKYLIQGESGVGKSSLAYLLMGQMGQGDEGVYLNGQPLKELGEEVAQSYLAFLPQKVKLFHASIWENISLGREVDEQEVLVLLQLVGLGQRFASRQQLESELFDAESTLSGGQQQRLALVRTLLLHKPVLLLDESLSGLDDRTFAMVEQALLDLEETTVIHISHRSHCEADYDQKVVLERIK
ncbi:TPA: ATP-binding cassette domain-containing protein [Streptococcus suis]